MPTALGIQFTAEEKAIMNVEAKVVQGATDGVPLPSLMYNPGGTPVGSVGAPMVVNTAGSSNIGGDSAGGYVYGLRADGAGVIQAQGNMLWNGTSSDLQRNNEHSVILASTLQTTTFTIGGLKAFNAAGMNLFLNISAISGAAATLTLKVQVFDPASSTYIDLPGASFAAFTTTGLRMLQIYAGIAAVANVAVNVPISRQYQLVGTISGTTPNITCSIGVCHLV